MLSTQLVVVGGGPGGYAAAFLAADLGLSTALVDPEPNPGGVCVYRGCIPSKALLHVAKLVEEARHAKAWGVDFGDPRIDLSKLRDFKNNVVKRLTSGTGQLVKHRKVQYIQGAAAIADPHSLRVSRTGGGEETLKFDHAILATGSVPAIPASLRLDDSRVMDSTAALDLPDIPTSLLVVGGGYIGLELGSVYATLGVAVGRRPNSRIPGLDSTRVKVDERGFIGVDEQMRPDEPSIFAIGDVVGEPMLAHKASHEGRIAVEVIAGENVAFEPRAIPAVVFTDPELAWCGLTETQATKEGRKVTVAKFPWGASG